MSTRPAPVTWQDFTRATERRLTAQERRPHPSSAADLLGPGIGPTALEISDWNSEVTGVNGFFFSQPGAINSPDPLLWWIGYSIADSGGIGYQRVTNYREPAFEGTSNPFPDWPGATYTRSFYEADGSSRAYSTWQPEGSGFSTEIEGTGGSVVVTGTSFNTIGNLTVDVNVTSASAVYFVNAIIDVQHTDTGNQLYTARMTAAGTSHDIVLRFNAQAINNLRQTLSGRWRVTGLNPGTRTIKMEHALSAPGNFTVNVNNCLMSVELAS